MNRNISSVLVGLCLISTMQSVFATPARTQSVKELIKLSEFENILYTSLDEMQPTLDSEAENYSICFVAGHCHLAVGIPLL